MKTFLISLVIFLATSSAFATARPDFASFKDVKQKKAAFFDYLYPFILAENKKILAERKIISSSSSNASELKKICKKYSKNCESIDATKKQDLLKRVDFIPPSLALAQGANESAWGTSRFAVKANNYFGQWCFTRGCGLVPARRDEGSKHEVRKFSTAQQSVGGYIFNLNTGRVYAGIRNSREQFRSKNVKPSGYDLAIGLKKYSQRGQAYVKEIRSMISFNKLVNNYDKKFWKAIAKLE